jgi:hypothetical protein
LDSRYLRLGLGLGLGRAGLGLGLVVCGLDYNTDMHAETLALLTKLLYFPNMEYLK